MSKIEGVAKKFDGSAIDYVSIFNWLDGTCIAQVQPDNMGNWKYDYYADLKIGITYVANGCAPVTHGAYTIVFDGTIDSSFYMIDSPFDVSLTDKKGVVWTTYGDANVSGGALRLDGAGDAISAPYSPNFHFGGGEDVTIRCVLSIVSDGQIRLIAATRRTSRPSGVFTNNNYEIYVIPETSGRVSLGITIYLPSETFNFEITKNMPKNSAFEMSLERKNMQWFGYIDGVQVGATSLQKTNYIPLTTGSFFTVGSARNQDETVIRNPERDFVGYIKNLKLIKGIAVGGGRTTTPAAT